MTMNLKIIGIGLVVVFVAIFVLFYIFDSINKIRTQCKTNKNLNICKLSSLPIVILMLLLIAGGLIVVINITAYIMVSGTTGGGYVKED